MVVKGIIIIDGKKMKIILIEKKTDTRKKKRNFKPPPTHTHTLCKFSTINKGKYFFNLIDKHFQKYNPLNKLFNWNTLKITYSSTNCISKTIDNQNKKLIDKSKMDNLRTNKAHCTSRNKEF